MWLVMSMVHGTDLRWLVLPLWELSLAGGREGRMDGHKLGEQPNRPSAPHTGAL